MNPLRGLCRALIALTLLCFSGLAAFAQVTYDAAADFSSSNNPNGAWCYGWEASRGAAFTLYGNHHNDGKVDIWATSNTSMTPGVWHNPSKSSVSEYTWTLPAHKLAFHPGQNGENSVIRWVAPTAGTVSLNAVFTGIDYQYPTTTDVAVLHNASTLFSGNIDSYNNPLPYATTLTVASGDTLDCNVGYGSDGNYIGDSTQVDATISYVNGPIVKALSPASANAGGPNFTLIVKGKSFDNTSVVHWIEGTSNIALTTTYVSPAQLKAAVPAYLISSPGAASILVVSPDAGTSNLKPFTILVTTLKMTSATMSRNSATGIYTAIVALKNIGYNAAPKVSITKATLGTAATTTTLPVSLGNVAAGASASATLTFPSSAGTSGSKVTLKVSGTFTGGKFAGSLNVTLP